MRRKPISLVGLFLGVSALCTSIPASTPAFAAEKMGVVNMDDVFSVQTPLTYTHFRSTPAVAETTIRRQVFFDDLEAGTGNWGLINYRQGHPNAWNIVSGANSCVGNAWWCGQTGLPYGDGYGNNWIQTLTTNVPISLTGGSNFTLTYKFRAQTEYGYDYGWVMMRGSNPGAKWDTLASYGGNFGASCSNASIDIPDSFITVTQPVVLMFAFASDLTVSAADSTDAFRGWSIDDVRIAGQGQDVRFLDDMESGPSKWITSAPNPGQLWHMENAPGTSVPASCFFLSSNVWTPFLGSGFGTVPDHIDAMFTSPPMSLEGIFSPNTPTTALRLQFDNWINLPYDNGVFWSLWVSGSNDLVTWTPWRNPIGLAYSGGNPQCREGTAVDFDPYYTVNSGIQPGTKYLRLGFRLRDQKLAWTDPQPLRLGYQTEGIYFDNIGVYYLYTISGVETVGGAPAGTRASIRKVFPNPFNPRTKIEFSVPKSGPVALRIFDLQGREVTTLVNETMSPGVYRVAWDGTRKGGGTLASGVYFAQIQSGGSRQSVRLTMLQ